MSSWQAESMPAGDESRLVAALRRGDETAFVALLDRYHLPMVRLAQVYVGDRPAAEDVAQETWLGVVRGIDRFEGRASLKTWLFRILAHQTKWRAEQATGVTVGRPGTLYLVGVPERRRLVDAWRTRG